MKAADVCTCNVVTAKRDTSITEAAIIMRNQHVGCLVVIEGSDDHPTPVGIITDRDIVIEVIAENVTLEKVTVGDIMSHSLLRINAEESILDTAQRLRAKGVRRAPLIDHRGELVGIIAMDDILNLLSEELCMLSHLTAHEATKEKAKCLPSI